MLISFASSQIQSPPDRSLLHVFILDSLINNFRAEYNTSLLQRIWLLCEQILWSSSFFFVDEASFGYSVAKFCSNNTAIKHGPSPTLQYSHSLQRQLHLAEGLALCLGLLLPTMGTSDKTGNPELQINKEHSKKRYSPRVPVTA